MEFKAAPKHFKNLALFWAFFKTSLVADIEFRFNFVTRIITDIFWYLAQIVTFEVLFLHTNKIGDWNIEQTRVFLGVLFIIDALYMTFLGENLDHFSDKVRKGDLDFILLKPVNSQFVVSFQRVATASLGNLIMAVGWFIWSLIQLPDFQPVRLLWLIILLPVGFIALYCVRFMFSATALVFTKAESFNFIWFNLYKIGMKPDSIYFPWLRYIILTIVPVGIIASVPTRAIVEAPNWGIFAWALISAPVFIYLSNLYWKYCLTKYASASS